RALKGKLMFKSDLTAVLWTMQETRANGVLSTAGADSEVPWQAQLALSEGQVTFCQIQNSADGQVLLTDSAAVSWLASLGNLSWEQTDPPPQQHPLSSPRGFQAGPFHPHAVPQRVRVVEQ